MCIDMNRQRLGDALIELTCNALVGRVYCIPLFDYLKANTPNAAFAYKWRLTPSKTALLVERIIPDGVRRWVPPEDAHRFFEMGGAYFLHANRKGPK